MWPGIQGNKYKFDNFRFFVYDVFDIDAQSMFHRTLYIQLLLLWFLEYVLYYQNMANVCATMQEQIEFVDGLVH